MSAHGPRRGAKFPHVKIIDWDLVNEADPAALSETKDPRVIDQLADTFLQADAVFADPSFSSAQLVHRLFSLMKVVLTERQATIIALRKAISALRSQSPEVIEEDQPMEVMRYVFQCTYCPKVFKTPRFLHHHVQRRHLTTAESQTKAAAPIIDRVTMTTCSTEKNQPETDDVFRSEMDAVLDRVDTLSGNMGIQLTHQIGQISRREQEDRELLLILQRAQRRVHAYTQTDPLVPASPSKNQKAKKRSGPKSTE
jgi:hypothetical protein